MSSFEEQQQLKDWFDNLPAEINRLYQLLSESVKKFQTFDLLSFVSYYNHLHDSHTYTDYRGDRNFIVPEVLALLCLKSDFISERAISSEEFFPLIQEIQNSTLKYCGLNDALTLANENKLIEQDIISDIANTLSFEAKRIRNPGLPDHHLIFAKKLYEPIDGKITQLLGFSVQDSISIRKSLPDLINNKCKTALKVSKNLANNWLIKVNKCIHSNDALEDTPFPKEYLEEFRKLSHDEVSTALENFFLNGLYFSFGDIYTFTAEEISVSTKLNLPVVEAFLRTFSCGFKSLALEDSIYAPISLLKVKPIIVHNGKYLIPSIPLLMWAVEDEIERAIKKSPKLANTFSKIKHDFLLKEGLELLRAIMPTAKAFPSNLFYSISNDKRCETDGIILFDRYLFIIEAKGHRISQRAKKGYTDRTQTHLKDIIQDSYEQAVRTITYIKENDNAIFRTDDGEIISIDRKDFDEVIIVCLTMEPIGNVSVSIKSSNDLGMFKEDNFPWIISIYDLVVLKDLLENPFLFVHYIKQRLKFQSNKSLSTYEELDIFSYYLTTGLFIERTLQEADEKNISFIEFLPDTDEINDYYMYKFGHKSNFTEKPKSFISPDFNKFLLELDNSKMPFRVSIALLMLDFSSKSIEMFMELVKKCKIAFEKDRDIHDCSVLSSSFHGFGLTFMTGIDRRYLDYKLHQYCQFKINQQNSNIWIGLGDVSTDHDTYRFKSMFFAMKKKLS